MKQHKDKYDNSKRVPKSTPTLTLPQTLGHEIGHVIGHVITPPHTLTSPLPRVTYTLLDHSVALLDLSYCYHTFVLLDLLYHTVVLLNS